MSRFFVLFGLLVISFSAVTAQNTQIKVGDSQVSAGIGLVPTFVGDKGDVIVPPISLNYTYQVSGKFSLGAFASYSSTTSPLIKYNDGSTNVFETKLLMVGIRPAVHFLNMENWDIYGGFSFGYNIPMIDVNSNTPEGPKTGDDVGPTPTFYREAENNFSYSGFIGATYFVKKNLGIYGEIGYGISLLNIGVAYKL